MTSAEIYFGEEVKGCDYGVIWFEESEFLIAFFCCWYLKKIWKWREKQKKKLDKKVEARGM